MRRVIPANKVNHDYEKVFFDLSLCHGDWHIECTGGEIGSGAG